MHSSLVVTQKGLPLGLCAIKFWSRDKFRGTAALKRHINPTRVPIERKESMRWLENLRQSTELLGSPDRCVHIGDRESDIRELFCLAQKLGTHFFTSNPVTVTVLPPQPNLGPCGKHCEEMAGEPIDLLNGNVWLQQNDYALPGTGGGMQLARTWNSLWPSSLAPATSGMFGQGWRSTYEERLTWPLDGVIFYWRGDGSYWCFGQGASPGSYVLFSPPDKRASLQHFPATSVFTLTLQDGSTRLFSESGYLLSITDRNGNNTSITYSGSNIATVTDPAGRVLSFNYANPATPNQASSIQDAAGVIANYTYDTNSNLTNVTYAAAYGECVQSSSGVASPKCCPSAHHSSSCKTSGFTPLRPRAAS
jgi:hypothetical protein